MPKAFSPWTWLRQSGSVGREQALGPYCPGWVPALLPAGRPPPELGAPIQKTGDPTRSVWVLGQCQSLSPPAGHVVQSSNNSVS